MAVDDINQAGFVRNASIAVVAILPSSFFLRHSPLMLIYELSYRDMIQLVLFAKMLNNQGLNNNNNNKNKNNKNNKN